MFTLCIRIIVVTTLLQKAKSQVPSWVLFTHNYSLPDFGMIIWSALLFHFQSYVATPFHPPPVINLSYLSKDRWAATLFPQSEGRESNF